MNGTTGTADDSAGSGGTAGTTPASAAPDPAGAAFRHAPLPMFVADRAGRLLLTNRAFTTTTGHRLDTVLDRPWPELLAATDAPEGWALHREALEQPPLALPQTLTLVGPDGDPHRFAFDPRPLRGPCCPAEEPTDGLVVLCHRLSPELDLLRTVNELHARSADAALWTLDLINGEVTELYGPSEMGQLLANEVHTLEEFLAHVHRDDITRIRDGIEACYEGRDFEQYFRMFGNDGTERWLHARARYVEESHPQLVGVVTDVTGHAVLARQVADRRRIETAQSRRVTELAAEMVSAATVNEVAALLTEQFMTIFGGHTASVLLIEEGVFRLRPPPTTPVGAAPLVDGRSADDARLPVGAVAQDRQPRFFSDRAEVLERFPAVEELVRSSMSQSWAFVPILGDRRRVLGVWTVSWAQPRRATPDERALLLTLAGMAGQALQRASRQQSDLELADAIQRRMLPPQLPRIPELDVATSYLPARADWRVCGDFYDVTRLPGRRVGLLVGDVQGHGVEAAAAMGQIRVAFRAYAASERHPGRVLAATNRLLTETGELIFATCGCVVLSLETGEMRAAWAGLPPAIVATTDEYDVWEPVTGPPVGVDGDAGYPETVRRLVPGETLLMCTDGLVESVDMPIDEGLERAGLCLRKTAGDAEVAVASLAEQAPAGRGDDIAILVARLRAA
ncbi:SpoIIE family protein phosphatase [Marinactinospora rubrisoli]|uniref:SpoIIE family protein phosphatase n=1 Tax=Marinactinospora rubrisoli TaxID=2715399 RepID=A0ABW2KGU1_9ACTN